MNFGVKTHVFERRPRNFKNQPIISKSNSKRIGPKFVCLQNRHDSLNQFQFFEIKDWLVRKAMAISNHGFPPKNNIKKHAGSFGGSANDRAILGRILEDFFMQRLPRMVRLAGHDHSLSPGLYPNHMQCTPGNNDESLI